MVFIAQPGTALELAARGSDAERLSLYEDRDRIARDPRDLVIQRLYATGMSVAGMVPMISGPEAAPGSRRPWTQWTRRPGATRAGAFPVGRRREFLQ